MSADNWTNCSKCGSSSFREDYEIGIWSGEFHASYRGRCEDCGYTFTFKHDAPVENDAERLRAEALAKLTPADRKALGLDGND